MKKNPLRTLRLLCVERGSEGGRERGSEEARERGSEGAGMKSEIENPKSEIPLSEPSDMQLFLGL
jgi:hypothetical protein